ncbi:5'-nucleotidase [Dysgonomonas sp. PH5-45]|uniref:5'/3'-nucleotidase SurE n=1 Tax=unclassified Dysgonomonas TaxID=2630389 RepID=UPI002474B371|nr:MULTISPECIES: 5'/3'-nucleotidase SurE [unclassified Dysgonomonas]MDH6355804.1 5'-nucleotidase [Dysgonomonas sp. PH5-45]MDH6388701.1 5'-nucleotidase [Dysgonomonas sp. PH5-37]
MEDKKPLIFITNDDGFQAKGIKTLVNALKDLGDIVVVAPDGPRSGMSSAITSLVPLRYHLVEKKDNVTLYSCSGTPVDCVKLGLSEIVERTPDLLVTGINHGSNASICVLYSGTMGAAIEGCIFDVPSIGFSLTNHHPEADFRNAEKVARRLSHEVLKTGLPKGICLNVNIPDVEDLKGIKVCRQTEGKWTEEFKRSEDGGNKTVFWLTGYFDNAEPNNQDTDEWALANNYVTVVPTKVDMTAHEFIKTAKVWENLTL